MVIPTKYYTETIIKFKNSLSCFSLFENRVTEGAILKSKNNFYINAGYKYIIDLDNKQGSNEKIVFKTVNLDTIFEDNVIDFVDIKRTLKRLIVWSILKKAFQQKAFIKGKILNSARGGYAVGAFGFVSFLSKKVLPLDKMNMESVFFIRRINYLKKTIILSQKNINKTASDKLKSKSCL